MKENVTTQKTFDFAIRIVNCYKYLIEEKTEFIKSKQLIRSGTSIGANTVEAFGGISKADFSAKISIAYKECQETQYWLKLLYRTQYLTDKIYQSMMNDAHEIGKILYAILYKTRI